MKCVDCGETLVKAHIEMEVGYLSAWICDCSDVEYIDSELVDSETY